MGMSRTEFDILHAGYSIAITGRRSDPAVVSKDYELLLEMVDFTRADDIIGVVPVFFRGNDGSLDCDFQPVPKVT